MSVQSRTASHSEQSLVNVAQIERRDRQLWWLSVTLVVLLAITVTAMDAYPLLRALKALNLDIKTFSELNGITVRLSLILCSFIICTYFRECARALLRLNRHLHDELEEQRAATGRKNVELSRMKQLSEVLMTQQDLASALEVALQMATEVVGADTASIMLLDDETQQMRIVAAKGLPDHVVKNARINMGEGLAGLAAQEGEPLIINNDDLDDRLRSMAHRTDMVQSAVITPIKVDGKVRGVINVTNRRDGHKYTRDDLHTIATLAQQASMVIQKIELYESLEQQVTKLSEALEHLSRTQAELTQAEKVAAVGQLASGVAHEINNPLHIMLGRAELLVEGLPDGSDERKNAQILCDQVERLSKVVRNLLKFARRGRAVDRQIEDINEVVHETLELLESQMKCDNIHVRFSKADRLPLVLANVGELQQVFLNLILNANHAMKENGGELEIVTRANSKNVEVIFSDTGPGIPKEYLPRIFEPFFSSKEQGEGSGLGLFVSYGIVESHGGRINVKSRPGAGACFTITLPVAAAAEAA